MPPSEGQSTQSLYKGLLKQTQECIITENKYIPEQELLKAVTLSRVKSDLRSTWSWLRLLLFNRGAENKLLQARKIIAVLAIIGQLNERSLNTLIANYLTDDDLPLAKDPTLRTRHGRAITFPGWEEAIIDSFQEKQWMVVAPVLDLKNDCSIEAKLDERCALELLMSNCENKGNTRFSRVYSAEIPSQVRAKPRRVAVKHFPLRNQAHDYKHEKENLDKIKDVNNVHLIKNLASCDEIHCIIFPWAEHGDLKQYWEEEADRSLSVVIWSIQQLAGLASALRDLHGVNCRHGDLKPSNIFYFKDGGGILKIADLGVSKVHSIATDQRKGETETKASTRAYEGPEAYEQTNVPRSRKYDCWSMACVILEFVVWLLYGQRALDGFHSSRDSRWNSFYQLKIPNPTSEDPRTSWWENMERHPKVDEVINLLREDARVTGTALEELINLVDSKLLLINPQSRLEAAGVAKVLHELVERCNEGQILWVNDVDAPTEVPAIFRQEPSRIPEATYE
ncbi:hypothetical protein LCI18_002781 [Fusarium solani-melongenae]|uniref:Uncharacterized protein n=1 Tax=Fusarium solani subsp. cucurbitae TaxID=2747967 RepID=A0ACD3YSI4_FUSSC|nr:hypothetical protein LCI18_002781 [Fusarium solani-melongenae]